MRVWSNHAECHGKILDFERRKKQNTACSPAALLCRVSPVVVLSWDRKAAGQMGQIDVTERTEVGLRVRLRFSESDSNVLFFSPVQQDRA